MLRAFLLSCHLFSDPIPVGKLPPEVIALFEHQIQQELDLNFSLQDDTRTKRATREYGYSFFRLEQGDRHFTPVPDFLQQLGRRICEQFGHPYKPFTNVILSLYDEGYHLEPHEDVNEAMGWSFFFDENVYGIIIEPDATGHLFFTCDKKTPIYSLSEEPGTIYCLQGAYRKAPYFHAVSQVSNRRISITFRTVSFSK